MEYIEQYREGNKISPTLEEIGGNFGITKITAYQHINDLKRKGALKKEKNRARAILPLITVR